MTRVQLPQRAGLPGLNGGGAAAAVPPDLRRYFRFEQIQDGGHRHVGKISSGDISATGRPIHFMFCSRVGFSGTADLRLDCAVGDGGSNGAIFDSNKFNAAILDNFEWPYLCNGSRSTYIAPIARSYLR